jgi:hypothetical protein
MKSGKGPLAALRKQISVRETKWRLLEQAKEDQAGPNKGVYMGVLGTQGVSNVTPSSFSISAPSIIGNFSVANAAGGVSCSGE